MTATTEEALEGDESGEEVTRNEIPLDHRIIGTDRVPETTTLVSELQHEPSSGPQPTTEPEPTTRDPPSAIKTVASTASEIPGIEADLAAYDTGVSQQIEKCKFWRLFYGKDGHQLCYILVPGLQLDLNLDPR